MGHMADLAAVVQNANESRILQFAEGLNFVICNALFMKQEAKLVSCAMCIWPVKSKLDYILV